MGYKRISRFTDTVQTLDVLHMLLHSQLYGLLSITNIFFAGGQAGSLIYDNLGAASPIIGTGFFVPAITREGREIERFNAGRNLGVQVALKGFSQVGEPVVAHGRAQPSKGGKKALDTFDSLMNRDFPVMRKGYLEIDSTLAIVSTTSQ